MTTGTKETNAAYHADLTISAYHQRPEYSSSQIRLLPDSPEMFYGRHILKHPLFQQKRTPSLDLGTALHDAVLENTPILTIPADVLSKSGSRAGKAYHAWVADHPGSVHCKADDPLPLMVMAVRNEPEVAEWLAAEGPVEHSIFFPDAVTGLLLRSRPDKIAFGDEGASIIIPDFKSTNKDVYDKREIAKVMAEYQHHRQGALYWDAVQALYPESRVVAFWLVFVRNCPPFNCHVHEVPKPDIELGRRQNRRALRDLRRRLNANDWKPSRYGEVEMTELPNYVYEKEERRYE